MQPSATDDNGLIVEGMRILVTGGSGHLGKAFARAAREAGHVPRIMSRRPAPSGEVGEWAQADLDTGDGLASAVAGVDAIVHAASDPLASGRTDVEGTRRLVEVARQAGVGHIIYVSIVGVDRIPFRYYRHKLETEGIVAAAGVPHSILRAAQFHYFVDMMLSKADGNPLVLPLPAGFRVQSIAIADVVTSMLELVARGPGGLLPDLVGPRAMSLREAAKLWLAARGKRRLVTGLWIPGGFGRAMRAGYNTAPDRPSGTVTWEAWLAERYGPR